METYDFVKALGEWHLVEKKNHHIAVTTALCGKPMTGHNFVNIIKKERRYKCKECFAIMEQRKEKAA